MNMLKDALFNISISYTDEFEFHSQPLRFKNVIIETNKLTEIAIITQFATSSCSRYC